MNLFMEIEMNELEQYAEFLKTGVINTEGEIEMLNEQRFRLKKNGKPNYRCFCRYPELIENYEKAVADTTQTWEVHHRKEELYSQKELIERGEYFDVSPEELIFLTPAEHNKIDSRCKRISEAMKGKKLSEEHKRKISKTVLCVETGMVFNSIMEAYRKTGINFRHISLVCNGIRKTAGGYHWKFV